MGDTGIDVDAIARRLRQWLADGKDVRVFAVDAAIPACPMVEMWDQGSVQVLTPRWTVEENRICSVGTR